MRYRIPLIQELKQLGFKRNHNTLNDFFLYIKKFVNKNRSELMDILMPGFDGSIYDERKQFINVISNSETRSIVERLTRLSNGKIIGSDYTFVVHPRHKGDIARIKNAWKRKLCKVSIDLQVAIYDQSFLNISEDEAIDSVFYNELLRYINQYLPSDCFTEECNHLDSINSQIRRLLNTINELIRTKGIGLLFMCYNQNLGKLYQAKYHLMFSNNESTAQKATRIYRKLISIGNPRDIYACTSIEEKELVLRHYLKSQTQKVVKSKNTRGRGIQKKKIDDVKQYFLEHPDASISKASRDLGFSRNTIRKHRPK